MSRNLIHSLSESQGGSTGQKLALQRHLLWLYKHGVSCYVNVAMSTTFHRISSGAYIYTFVLFAHYVHPLVWSPSSSQRPSTLKYVYTRSRQLATTT